MNRPACPGVAHFLEHLMFKGTDDVESGEFSRIVEDNGGTDNAFTSWDYTGYFQRVAADRLGLMMELEADRMRDLRFADEEVVTERSVILEERAERVDSSAGGLFNEQMRATLYNNHPYGIPIIGWRHEMEQLDREALIAFYEAITGRTTPSWSSRAMSRPTRCGPCRNPLRPDPRQSRHRTPHPSAGAAADRRSARRATRTSASPTPMSRAPIRARARTRRSAPRRRADHAGRNPRRIGADLRPRPAVAGRGGTRALAAAFYDSTSYDPPASTS
jgi:hypothetical protein